MTPFPRFKSREKFTKKEDFYANRLNQEIKGKVIYYPKSYLSAVVQFDLKTDYLPEGA